MIKLKELPSDTTTRLNIQIRTSLKEKLDDYATIYAQTYGKAQEVKDLIPYMLEIFLDGDIAFKKARRDLHDQPLKKEEPSEIQEPPRTASLLSSHVSFPKDKT